MYRFDGETYIDFMCFVLVSAMCSRMEGSGLEVEEERLSQHCRGSSKVIRTTSEKNKEKNTDEV